MKNAVPLTLFLLLPSFASAVGEVQCVSANVAIALTPSAKGEQGFEAILTASRDENMTTLRYDRHIDFIGVEWRKNICFRVLGYAELDAEVDYLF